MMKKSEKLENRVENTHAELMSELKQFEEKKVMDKARFTKLKQLFDRMNACHYAEERALYPSLEKSGLIDAKYFRSYHMMLENLCESIKLGGHMSDALVLELKVLRVLTSIHFNDEKTLVLSVLESHCQEDQNKELGRLYERAFSKMLA